MQFLPYDVRAQTPPLLRPAPRAAVAAGALLAGLLAAVVGLLSFLLGERPVLILAAFAPLAAAPVAGWVMIAGQWSRVRGLVAVQLAAAAVTLAFYAFVVVRSLAEAIDALGSRSTLGVSPSEAGGRLLVVAAAFAAIAFVIAALPIAVGRRGVVAVVAAVGAAAVGALAAGTYLAVGRDQCRDFRFDRTRWERALGAPDPMGTVSDAEQMGRAIVRCDTVDGATRAEVARLLGAPSRPAGRRWTWGLGTTNDGIGPGDGQALEVAFGRDGRVRDASLTYP